MNNGVTPSPLLRKKKILDRRIPTLIGLAFLVVALAIGTLFIGKGSGVFAPRATPATTPTKVKITNVTDNSFTVSFVTSEKTAGYVKYGADASSLKTQSSDDRDQLSGNIGTYSTHHVSVRGLNESTTYHFVIGTGSGSTFDNNGAPFSIKTAKRSGAPSAAKTVYGSVTNPSGAPADGAVVYISLAGAGELSSLVKNSGSWAVPLSNARTPDGSGYAQITDTQELTITVQGTEPNQSATSSVLVSQAQPVSAISLGAGGGSIAVKPSSSPVAMEPSPIPSPVAEEPVAPSPEPSVEPSPVPEAASNSTAAEATNSAETASTSEEDEEATVVDLDGPQDQIVTTTKPIITGTAAPNVVVTITVHSNTQIVEKVTTSGNGTFNLDLEALAKDLEPGEHTATYSYIDPATGQEVSETVTFTVRSSSQLLAQANTNTTPYGSGNPYPVTSPSPTPSPSPSPTPLVATQSAVATDSGRVSLPSTESAIPTSGSVGTTWTLVLGGMFFIIAGVWSFWIAQELKEAPVEVRD